jgi:hypothetical protein
VRIDLKLKSSAGAKSSFALAADLKVLGFLGFHEDGRGSSHSLSERGYQEPVHG